MVQEIGHTLDDRKTDPRPLIAVAGLIVVLVEFFKDERLFLLGDANAAIAYFDTCQAPITPAFYDDIPPMGVFDGITDQVLKNYPQQGRVAAYQDAAWNEFQHQPLIPGNGLVLIPKLT
jgi:hypothetical protein